MKKITFVFLIALFPFLTLGQEGDQSDSKPFSTSSDQVQRVAEDSTNNNAVITENGIVQEERLQLLLKKHIELNKEDPSINGFRIHLFSESGENSKSKIHKLESEFLQKYPDVPTHVEWQYPNYMLRIGDFRTRLMAMEFHAKIREEYPSAFITRDEIELPPLGE